MSTKIVTGNRKLAVPYLNTLLREAGAQRSMEKSYGIDFAAYFKEELKMLASMQRDGLVDMDNSGIRVTRPHRMKHPDVL